MCRKFFPGISGGVLTPLTPPLDPPLTCLVPVSHNQFHVSRFYGSDQFTEIVSAPDF